LNSGWGGIREDIDNLLQNNELWNVPQVIAAPGAAIEAKTSAVAPDLAVVTEAWRFLSPDARKQILAIILAQSVAAQAGTPQIDGISDLHDGKGFRGNAGERGIPM
jgi:hypothetical protein